MRTSKLAVYLALPATFALLAAACGGGSADAEGAVVAGDQTRQIPLGEWCTAAGKQVCGQMGERCMGGGALAEGFVVGCRDSFSPGCVAARDPASASGRTAADLNVCLATLAKTPCEQMMTPEALAPCRVAE